MKAEDLHITIIGAGESGIGAALLAQEQGNRAFVSDNDIIGETFKRELAEHAISYEEGGHSLDQILKSDLVIKSPGIPSDAPVLKTIRDEAIPVIGEVEYADRFTQGTKIGITGTNGKTTTVQLIYEMLFNEGCDVALAGNIGTSFSRKVAYRDYNYWVLELSSFQLEDIASFQLSIAGLLNITPDHLNRYNNSMEDYAAAKFRIWKNQTENDYLVYNYDDPLIQQGIQQQKPASKKLPFSLETQLAVGSYMKNDKINLKLRKEEKPMAMKSEESALKGKHNAQNAMAASIIGRALKIRKKTIRESLQNFQTIEHRLENVLDVHGITFINDSKGSNLNSVWFALESMKTPVVLIAGGLDKGNDYELIKPLVKEKVKAMVCLGKDNSRLNQAFKSILPMSETADMQEAVKMAYDFGEKGDTVLLSPGCASFDLFKNFEERGKQFKDAVYKL